MVATAELFGFYLCIGGLITMFIMGGKSFTEGTKRIRKPWLWPSWSYCGQLSFVCAALTGTERPIWATTACRCCSPSAVLAVVKRCYGFAPPLGVEIRGRSLL